MNKHSEQRIGIPLPTPRPVVGKKPGARGARTKVTRSEIRREASATQHASRASLRTPERSGQKRAHLPAKKK